MHSSGPSHQRGTGAKKSRNRLLAQNKIELGNLNVILARASDSLGRKQVSGSDSRKSEGTGQQWEGNAIESAYFHRPISRKLSAHGQSAFHCPRLSHRNISRLAANPIGAATAFPASRNFLPHAGYRHNSAPRFRR